MLRWVFLLLPVLLAVLLGANDQIGQFISPEGLPPGFTPRERWGDTAGEKDPPKPFTASIDKARWEELRKDLRRAIERTPAGGKPSDEDPWEYGIPRDVLKDLLQRWEGTDPDDLLKDIINRHPQYTVTVKGLRIHYAHVSKPGKGEPKVVLMLHGWPGSFIEFWKVLGRLRDTIEGPVEFIVPSLPGYGFSEGPSVPGMHALEMAGVMQGLMKKLGYRKYWVQGGDWGSIVGQELAKLAPEALHGLHINFHTSGPPPPLGVVHAFLPSLFLDPEDSHRALPLKNMAKHTGYMHQQATFPDTLAVGLEDSPAGLAAWIGEKFYRWGDVRGKGPSALWDTVSSKEVIADITVYWMSRSIASSMRLYKETLQSPLFWQSSTMHRIPKSVKVGVLDLPAELFNGPKRWAEFQYPGMVRFTRGKAGGHFAALEQPDTFVADFAAFLKMTRPR